MSLGSPDVTWPSGETSSDAELPATSSTAAAVAATSDARDADEETMKEGEIDPNIVRQLNGCDSFILIKFLQIYEFLFPAGFIRFDACSHCRIQLRRYCIAEMTTTNWCIIVVINYCMVNILVASLVCLGREIVLINTMFKIADAKFIDPVHLQYKMYLHLGYTKKSAKCKTQKQTQNTLFCTVGHAAYAILLSFLVLFYRFWPFYLCSFDCF